MAAHPIHALDETGRPVRKAIRRLRWFIGAFREQVALSGADTGMTFAIDDTRVTAVFIDWLEEFERQKPRRAEDRRAFVGFAAGLMLRALIRHDPLTLTARPAAGEGDADSPASFWPEGFVYVAFCLNIRSAVLDQDFHEDPHPAPALADLRSWWSFRENVAEDPSLSIAFLDLFAGEQPEWTMADVFRSPEARQVVLHFHEQARLP